MCANGDVLIVLAPDMHLKLHAAMLQRHSKFFREHLIQENATTLSSTLRARGETMRWRFDLVERPEIGDDGPGKLQMVADLSGNSEPNPIYSHYTKILGSFYSQQFDIEDADITALLREVVGLIEVSEYLGCVHAVSRTIDAALLGQGQILFRSIASNPTAWVDLAVRVQSASVFQEAVVHLTGQWNTLGDDVKGSLDGKVRELCAAKAHELDERKKMVECRILKFYPHHMGREVGAPPGNVSRMSYGNDIMDWIALGVFRHWFSSALALDRNRRAEDGGYWLYSRLAEGQNAYLTKQELQSFHERFPMTTRGENVLERHVNQLKEDVRPLVAELMKNESQLDCERFAVQYLTCVKVEKTKAMEMWNDKRGEMLNWSTQASSYAPGPTSTIKKGKKRSKAEAAVAATAALTTTREVPGPFREDSDDDRPIAKKAKCNGAGGLEEGGFVEIVGSESGAEDFGEE
ncbi:hypothetical protein EJ08DRAFT_632188 [Tothia fuscella]|uniref:BTB domain-containing protein n=1 Tax=Tothia fuscella TaxID=1048955 RepID=A0A9P4NTB0_9PEZI|nr:hypothetical protein EJ08DRAFT_632188 [Tothia fuscella]